MGSGHPFKYTELGREEPLFDFFSFAELGSHHTCTIELLVAILKYLHRHIII